MLYAPTEFQALYYMEGDVNMKKSIPTLSSSFQLAKLGHVAIIKWICWIPEKSVFKKEGEDLHIFQRRTERIYNC